MNAAIKRPFEVLELNLSGLATNQASGISSEFAVTREQLPRVTRRTALPANRTLTQGQVRLLPALACRKCPGEI